MTYVGPESNGSVPTPPVTRLPTHRRVRPPFARPIDNPAYMLDVTDPKGVAEGNTSPTPPPSVVYEELYDPYDQDHNNEHGTSFGGTVFHVLIIVCGPPVLSIPSVLVDAGYVVGFVLVPLLVLLYAHVASMVVWTEYQLCRLKRVPSLTYSQVAYQAFAEGPRATRWLAHWVRVITYVVFVFVWFGFCCYNYVIVADNLRVLVANTFDAHFSIEVFLESLIVPLALLGCIPKLKYLVPFSMAGNVFNGLSLLLILYYVFVDPTPWNVPAAVGQLSKLPVLTGTVLFNLNMTGILLTLKSEMKVPSRYRSGCGVITLSFALTSAVYTFFSLVCCLKYGASTMPSIIENVPQNDKLAQIGILLSSLSLITQYPLALYVPFDIVWNQLLKPRLNSQFPTIWQYTLRMALVFLSFAVSVAVPNVFLFLTLSGTVGTSIDSLFFPALAHSIVAWKTCKSRNKFWLIFMKNMVILALAIFLVVTGVVDSVNQIVDYYSSRSVGQ